MTNAGISNVALPLTATQEWVKSGYQFFLFIYVEEPRLKSLTKRTLGFSEYGLTNANILSLALPLTATQNWLIKRGNQPINMYLCKKAMLKPVSYRTLGFSNTD